MRVSDLQRQHPEYRPDLIELYGLWYDGGHRFSEALCQDDGKLLGGRIVDDDRFGKKTYRDLRREKAQYNSELSRIIGNIISTAFKKRPHIVSTGAGSDYYNSLNYDCDGSGTPFSVKLWRAFEGGMVHSRAYLAPDFPPAVSTATDYAQAKALGQLDGRVVCYQAKDVINWDYDAHGVLEFITIYGYDDEAEKPWMPATYRRHTWTIIDRAEIYSFEYVQKRNPSTGTLDPIPPNAAVSPTVTQHAYPGRVPVIPFRFASHFWVADRLADGQKALFNSEADERFIRAQCAHPQPVITGVDGNIGNLYKSELHALVLPTGADYKLVGPGAEQSTWHETAIARERSDLYAALDSMKLFLASQPQNARQSAEAKKLDSSGSTSLIQMFASALKDTAMQCLRMIQEKRGDTADIHIVGLDDIDGRSLDQMIAEAKAFFELSPPQAARTHVMRQVSLAMCAGAPESVVDEIQNAPCDEARDEPEPNTVATEDSARVVPGAITEE